MKIVFFFTQAFIFSVIFTPLLCKICLRLGILDMPSERKVHTKATPRLGGIAIIFAFILTLLFAFIVDVGFRGAFSSKITGIFIAIILLILLGLWDDIRGMRPIIKLFVQIIAALILFYSGLGIKVFTNPFGGGELQLPYGLSLFLTIFWIVGMINAINLIDGLAGVSAIIMDGGDGFPVDDNILPFEGGVKKKIWKIAPEPFRILFLKISEICHDNHL